MSKTPATDVPAIRTFLAPIRIRLMLAEFFAGLGQVLSLAPLAGIALISQKVLLPDVPAYIALPLWTLAFLSVTALLLGLLLITLAEFLAHLADDRLTHGLRTQVSKRLTRVPLGWFTSQAASRVKQALHDDMGTLHDLTAHYFTTRARCMAAIVTSALFLCYIDWRMALISLAPFPLHHMIMRLAKKSISPDRMGHFVTAQAQADAAVSELGQAMPVLRVFGTTGRAHSAYTTAVKQFHDAFSNFTRPLVGPLANANALITPVSVLTFVLAFGVVFIWLDWLAPIDLLPFVLMAPAISAPMLLLGFMAHGMAHATAAAQRITAVLTLPLLSEPQGAGSDANAQPPQNSALRFENVSYSYESDAPVLSEIDLHLKPGTVTAIVGASGGGKSTLARLALRFFDPTQGRITLGGVDLREIRTSQLYRDIGFVLQDVQLIHANLHDNIALGRASATREEVEAAARAAHIHNRIMDLSDGYETIVGQGVQLSGGEAQRISIARTILLDPSVLILDEATAALDAQSEIAVQNALSQLVSTTPSSNKQIASNTASPPHAPHDPLTETPPEALLQSPSSRTLMVIAHRLETITTADQIVVLDQGKIQEIGTHEELLKRNGWYARLWAKRRQEQTTQHSDLPHQTTKGQQP